LRELKANTTTCQTSVDLAVGIKSVVDTSLLLLVKDDLQDLAAIFLGAETLANDLDWVDEVAEDGVVDGSECAGTRTLLRLGSAGSVATLGAGKNAAAGKNEDVTVREFLLKLTGESFEISALFHKL
jgi:hypothetical protein